MRALPHREVAAALATVRTSGAPQAFTLAFEFLVLTAARSGEVRLAAWDEMDTADHVWTIPATRMKMKRDHRVPLCGRALAILAAARTLGGSTLTSGAIWCLCESKTQLRARTRRVHLRPRNKRHLGFSHASRSIP